MVKIGGKAKYFHGIRNRGWRTQPLAELEYVFGESDLSTSLPIDGIYMYMRQELLETWDGKLKTQNLI